MFTRHALLPLSIALVMWCTGAGAGTFTQNNWSGGATANTATHPANQTGWTQESSVDSGLSITGPLQIQSSTVSTTLTQTSDDGSADSVNAGGFNAGTTTGGVTVLGDGAAAQLAVPAPALISSRNSMGDGHNGVSPAGWPLLKDLGDGHNAISTATWPLLNNQGDGTDGAVTFSSGTVDLSVTSSDSLGNAGDDNPGQPDGFTTALTATASAGATALAVGSSAGFVVGDQVMIIQIQHAFQTGRDGSSAACPTCGLPTTQTYEFRDAGNAGKYEFATVNTIPTGASLTLSTGLINNYYATGFGKAQVIRVPQYSTVTLNAGVTLTTAAYNSTTGTGGVLIFKANSTVTVNGTIDMDGKGYAGGQIGGATNLQGQTFTGYRQDNYSSINFLGGFSNFGGGGVGGGSNGAGGGGHGSAGVNGTGSSTNYIGNGGLAYGSPDFTTILPGSGGGAGDNLTNGGSGGGIIFITGSSITLSGAAIIRANGTAVGSGGAGGSIYIGAASTATVGTNQVTTAGGVATGSHGSGGVGRIYIEGTLSGTTSPTAVASSGARINGYPTGVINSYASMGATDYAAGATSITVATSEAAGFATGDEILVIQMQHPANAGRYEFKKNVTVTNNGNGTTTFSFTGGLLHRYYGSASSGKAQLVRVPNYTNFVVGGGTAITTPDYDPATGKGGMIAFRATGTVTVDGKIDTLGRGFPGGQLYLDVTSNMHVTQGWSYNGVTPTESPLNNAGGGGVRMDNVLSMSPAPGTAAGGGSYATVGTSPGTLDKDASAGITYGESSLGLLMLGSGGGGTTTGAKNGNRPATGGYGGGAVFISVATVNVSSAGLITARGGEAPSAVSGVTLNVSRQGGAGSGGSIYLGSNNLTINTQRVDASGGGSVGVNATYLYRTNDVITGGNGRIYIEGTLTGTATPTATTGSNASVFAWPNGVINKYASAGANNYTAGTLSVSVTAANGIVTGDEILIIQMSHATNAGTYEFKTGVTVSGNTISFGTGLVNSYFGTGSGGQTQVVSVPNYTDLIVADGEGLGLIAAPYTAGTGGIIAFRANGTVTIRGPIDAAGKGFGGGPAQTNNSPGIQGSGSSGVTAALSTFANVGGGGGGGSNGFAENQAGGGGGGYGTAGKNGQGWNNSVIGATTDYKGLGGNIYGDAILAQALLGSGGGSGSANNVKISGAGGAGGGLIFMTANTIALAANGSINARGIGGGHPSVSNTEVGGGGGGSGGSIFLATNTVSQWLGTISATGGIGGGFTTTTMDTFSLTTVPPIDNTKGPIVWLGGDGGKGRIRVEVPGGSLPADISSAGVVSIADATTPSTGTFTSAVILAGSTTDYGVISWTPTPPAGKIVTVEVRAGNTLVPDGTWTAFTAVTNGQNLGATYDSRTYIQYRITMNGSGGSASVATTFDDLSIAYSRTHYPVGTYVLVSSPFNSTDSTNTITALTWGATTPANTSLVFQMRTSADGTGWGPWYGTPVFGYPNGLDQYYTASGQVISPDHKDSMNDQYFQYRAILTNTIPTVTPALTTVSVGYNPGTPAIKVEATTATAFENGGVGVFRISKLGNTAVPFTANYTVSGTATAGSDYTSLSGSIAFLATDSFKTINVTPIQDVLGEGDETVILTLTPSASYDISTPSAATVTIVDDETAGITVTPTSGLATTEAGGTAQFTVVLVSQPAANVTIGVSTSDTTEGAPTPPSLLFTTGNWSTPQTVTVTGVNDTSADGNITYSIITAPAVSIGGGAYNGLDAADVTVINVDNDSTTISVTPVSGLYTTENAGQASFNVAINGTPTGNVTIGISSTDTTEGTVGAASLIFTPANAAFPQTVTVTGQSDALSDGSISYSIVTAAATSTDANYNNFNAPDVTLVNLDANPGISVIEDKSASNGWPFTNAKDYTLSDATKSEISAGVARIKQTAGGTVLVQTSENGAVDTPNAGGFNAGTIPPSVSVTGVGAAASVVKAITAGQTTTVIARSAGNADGALVISATGQQTSVNQAWNNALDRFAKVGAQALSLEGGTGEYISVGSVTSANATTGSYSMWVRIPTTTVPANPSLWAWFTSTTANMYLKIDTTASGSANPEFAFCFDSSASAAVCAYSGINPTDMLWHHVTAVWGSGGFIRIYVDGVLRASTAASGSITATSAQWVGRPIVSGTSGLNGYLDELAFYNTALNATQVSYLYTEGNAGRGIASGDATVGTGAGLIGLWHLDDGALIAQKYQSPVINMGSPADLSTVSWTPVAQSGTAQLQVGMRKGSTLNVAGLNVGTLAVGASGTQTTAQQAWDNAIRTPVDGQGIAFDGTDDRVTVGTNNRPTNNFTVETWVRPNSGAITSITTPVNTGTAGATGQRYLFGPQLNAGSGDSNNAGMGISIGSNGVYVFENATGYFPPVAVYNASLNSNLWYHVAVVYTNKVPQIYVNAAAVGSSVTSAKTNVYAPVEIGGAATVAASHFAGWVDQAAVWNYSLSAAEIATHFVASSLATQLTMNPKLTGEESGLVGLWHFSEGTGVSIADSAPNTNWSAWTTLTNGADTLATLDGQQYLQYRAVLTNSTANTAVFNDLSANGSSGGGSYFTDIVTVTNKTGIAYQQLLTFADTLGPNHAGTVKFQLSNNGTNWYYHNGTAWVAAASAVLASANTGGEVAARIGSFATDVGTGTFYFRALLNSPTGAEAVELDKVAVGYIGTTVTTSESGQTGTFKIVLNTAPTADVSVNLSSADTTEGTPSASSVIFTSSDWSTAQTVTVNPVNDNVDDGDITYNIVTAAAASADATYNGMGSTDVAVTNLDDDIVGITITPISGLQTSEGGSTATFTVVLDSEPTSGVTIGLSSSNAAEGTVTPSVSFTTVGWSSPQAVVVTGANDAVIDGSIGYSIITAASTSADSLYNGINPADVSATNIDNDNTTTGVIIVTPTAGLTTTESGGTATFSVVLNIAPASSNVVIGLSSSDTTEGTISIASLIFTTGNWSVPQLVTVTGVDDVLNDGHVTYSIVTQPATGDARFVGVNAPDVTVVNNDNDFSLTAASSQIITVSAEDAGASEGSADSAAFTITRAGRTANDLVVNYSVSGTASAGTDYTALSGSVLIPEGESSASVIIAALDDSSYEGDETVELKITEGSYVISAPSSASVVIYDNETPPPAVNIGLDQTVEEGATVKVSVYLADSAPEYPVTIPYTVSGNTTAGADHDVADGVIAIASGTTGSVSFNTHTGGGSEADETVVITLGTPGSGARLGQRARQTVIITEGNVAPSVNLSAKQSNTQTRLVVKAAELVTVTANVTDANAGDTAGYNWSASSALVRENSADNAFVFNPASVAAGTYTVTVTVSDGEATTTADLTLQVIDSASTLGSTDSDGDGVNDNLEGFGDSDNDGIPNYQDASTLTSAELQGEALNSEANVLNANPELNLTLGNTAFGTDGDAHVDGQVASDSISHSGGDFDISVTGIPQPRDSIDIVVPQAEAILANAVYRQYTSTGWSDFVIDDSNAIASAQGTAGNCPAANDPAYTAGLIAGSHCVQLTIEDGGPNDADAANNTVSNTGGVGSRTVSITISSGTTGGGAMNLFGLAALLMLVGVRIVKQRKGDR